MRICQQINFISSVVYGYCCFFFLLLLLLVVLLSFMNKEDLFQNQLYNRKSSVKEKTVELHSLTVFFYTGERSYARNVYFYDHLLFTLSDQGFCFFHFFIFRLILKTWATSIEPLCDRSSSNQLVNLRTDTLHTTVIKLLNGLLQ